MTNSKGGRPPAAIITENFTCLESVGNRSGRYYWKCNYCPEGSAGAKIEGRDNRHIKHLINPCECPDAPVHVRKQALTYLSTKNFSVELIGVGKGDNAVDKVGNDETPVEVHVSKKRKGTLDGYVDVPMTEAQIAVADRKLLRYETKYLRCHHLTGH